MQRRPTIKEKGEGARGLKAPSLQRKTKGEEGQRVLLFTKEEFPKGKSKGSKEPKKRPKTRRTKRADELLSQKCTNRLTKYIAVHSRSLKMHL